MLIMSCFRCRCRTRSGLRLLGVEEISNAWTVRVDMNARGTTATVTAFKKTLQTTSQAASSLYQQPPSNIGGRGGSAAFG
jgi:hypothetical protein